MSTINILVIGAGPHARRIYLPILLRSTLPTATKVVSLVDLESQRETISKGVLAEYPEIRNPIFLNQSESLIVQNKLTPAVDDRLTALAKENNISAVIVSSEPSTHIAYAKWALNNRLHILMDKPISAPDNLANSEAAVKQILDDYYEIADLYKAKKAQHPELRFNVMAQRRYHPAFQFMKEKIMEVTSRTSAPITSFQSLHSDGQWRMPSEIVDQDYHPYNRGYGKCLHSGYHAIDIANWLVAASYREDCSLTKINTYSNFVYPNDFLTQLPLDVYSQLFNDFAEQNKYNKETLSQKFRQFGEIDAQIALDYKQANDSLTVGQLSLQHNGFGQRNWSSAKGRDLYKGNGRVRHEKHYFTQGPFQAIYYESLQSEEILNKTVNHSDIGGEYHLDVHVFRNSRLFSDWKSYEKFTLEDFSVNVLKGYSRGHQEDARRSAVIDFLKGIEDSAHSSVSDLLDHEVSTSIIAAAYQSALNKKLNNNPVAEIKLADNTDAPKRTREHVYDTAV